MKRLTVGFVPELVDEPEVDYSALPERLSLDSVAFEGRKVDSALGSDPIPSMAYDAPVGFR